MPYYESEHSKHCASAFVKERARDPLSQLHFDCAQAYSGCDSISPVFGVHLPIRAVYDALERTEHEQHIRRVVLYKHLPKKMYHVKMWDTDVQEYSWSGESYETAAAMYCAMWMPMSWSEFYKAADWVSDFPGGIETITLSAEQSLRLVNINLTHEGDKIHIKTPDDIGRVTVPFSIGNSKMGVMDNPQLDLESHTLHIPNPLHLSEHAVAQYIVMQALVHGVLEFPT